MIMYVAGQGAEPTLRSLDLTFNNIQVEGAEVLASALQVCLPGSSSSWWTLLSTMILLVFSPFLPFFLTYFLQPFCPSFLVSFVPCFLSGVLTFLCFFIESFFPSLLATSGPSFSRSLLLHSYLTTFCPFYHPSPFFLHSSIISTSCPSLP